MPIILPVVAALLLTPATTRADCDATLRGKLERQLTPILEAHADSGAFSGVVLVACKGEPVYSAAYGQADRQTGAKNTLDTRFNLGSANKMWTAVAVAQLVEQGKVDLDAPVGRYLPDLPIPEARERVLVRHLLSHTSGLGSYFKPDFVRAQVALTRAADLTPFIAGDSLAFAPGSGFRYSNTGYAILGMLVERVSGMSYFDYVKKNVFERAGMQGAAFVTLPLPASGYAVGYTKDGGGGSMLPNTERIERSSSPAGGAYATARDLLAFGRALWGGKLVGLPTVREFTTGKVDMGPGARYAFGFGDIAIGGWRSVGHNGGAAGVNAEFVSFPEHDIDVVVLANVDPPEATRIFREAAKIVTGPAGP